MHILVIALLSVAAFVFIFYWFLYARSIAVPKNAIKKILLVAVTLYPFLCIFSVLMTMNLLHIDLPYPGVLFFAFHFLLTAFCLMLTMKLYKQHKGFVIPAVLNTVAGILYFGGMLGGII